MNSALIDTNVYSAFKTGVPSAVRAISRFEHLLVCTTVIGELLSGFKCGSKELKNRNELEEFLDMPRVKVVPADFSTAEYYSQIYKALRNKGCPIPTNDMWIAASALQNGVAVCSFDSHFNIIDGLIVFTPSDM